MDVVGSHLDQFEEWRGKQREPSQAYPKTLDKDKIPFVFRWEYGGGDVYVCGSFTDWSTKLPLTRRCVRWLPRPHITLYRCCVIFFSCMVCAMSSGCVVAKVDV